MAAASKDTALILALAEAYCAQTWSTPDSVSGRIFGKGGFFRRLRSGGDCTTATAWTAFTWFAENWPEGVAWPAGGCTCRSQPAAPVGLPGRGDDVLARLAHLPVWKNGRRPAWWSDIGIRRFLTEAHRQMTLAEAVARGRERFGPDFPSKSAVHTYWQRLDQVVGQITAKGVA